MRTELACVLITRFEDALKGKYRRTQVVLHAMKLVMVVLKQVSMVALRVRMAISSIKSFNVL